MKTLKKMRSISFTTITNTGHTTISGTTPEGGGDIGMYSGSAFPGKSDVTLSGIAHINDTVAIKAKTDLVAAYDDAAGRTPVTRISTELGGTTLKPGIYDSGYLSPSHQKGKYRNFRHSYSAKDFWLSRL